MLEKCVVTRYTSLGYFEMPLYKKFNLFRQMKYLSESYPRLPRRLIVSSRLIAPSLPVSPVMNCELKHALHCAVLLAWIFGFAYFCGVFSEPDEAQDVPKNPIER